MTTPRFGVRRLVHPDAGAAERLLFRTMGVADPAHYLHHLYLRGALSRMGGASPRNILDAGCGRGDHTIYLAQRYPNATVVGLDIDESRIAMNQRIASALGIRNVSFEVRDLRSLPWVGRFDLVVSIDVLEHIVEQQAVMEALRRTLVSGGHFFFHVPTIRRTPVPFSTRLGGFHDWAEHEHTADERSAEEFVALVGQAGLTVTEYLPTFGYFTGELATSLFCLPFQPTTRNKVLQAFMAPFLRPLVFADQLGVEKTRFAVAVRGRKH